MTNEDGYPRQKTVTGPLFDPKPDPRLRPSKRSLGDALRAYRSTAGRELREEELAVAAVILTHEGRDDPISIAMVAEATDLDERTIKGAVETLRQDCRARIGARRERPWGYFMVVDDQDLETAIGPYKRQIQTMVGTLAAMAGERHARDFLRDLLKES